MRTVTIAFDVDGTLIKEITESDGYRHEIINEDVRMMLVTLARLRNVRIHLWSGSGEAYARTRARELGITQYIYTYSSKTDAGFVPEIAVDDVETTSLGTFNLILASAHSSEERASAS